MTEEGPLGQCSVCHKEFDFVDEGSCCPNCGESFCDECWSREGECPHCGEIL